MARLSITLSSLIFAAKCNTGDKDGMDSSSSTDCGEASPAPIAIVWTLTRTLEVYVNFADTVMHSYWRNIRLPWPSRKLQTTSSLEDALAQRRSGPCHHCGPMNAIFVMWSVMTVERLATWQQCGCWVNRNPQGGTGKSHKRVHTVPPDNDSVVVDVLDHADKYLLRGWAQLRA